MRFLPISLIAFVGFVGVNDLALAQYAGDGVSPKARLSSSANNCPFVSSPGRNLSIRRGIYQADGVTRLSASEVGVNADMAKARDAAFKVFRQADAYVRTKNVDNARCAAGLLYSLAQQDALGGEIDGAQAQYNRIWMLSSYGLSWFKIKGDAVVAAEQRDVIDRWLAHLAQQVQQYIVSEDTRRIDKRLKVQNNNIRYWAGLSVMAVGFSVGERGMVDWGIDQYNMGVDSVDSSGFLAGELRRKGRARHYHVFAATPLVVMAELADLNNIDLYGRNSGALDRLVRATVSAYFDPSLIQAASGSVQLDLEGERPYFGWLRPYAQKFPDDSFFAVLQRYPELSNVYVGGLPPSRK